MDPLAHASLALVARPLAPKAPVWALVAATQAPDLLFFAFQAAGLEHEAGTQLDLGHGLTYLSPPLIPWSHGLVMCLVWSLVAGGLAYLFLRDRRAGLLTGAMVFGHWFLDFTVYLHMPVLFAASPATGLGLISSQLGFIVGCLLEVGLVVVGVIAAVRLWQRRRSGTVRA